MNRPWEPPANLDRECLELCKAMNALDGIETFESCCGHGNSPFWIWFTWRPPSNGMTILARVMSDQYYGFEREGWRIILNHTDLPESQVCFLLEGPVGTEEADGLSKTILQASDDLGQREYYGQDFAGIPPGDSALRETPFDNYQVVAEELNKMGWTSRNDAQWDHLRDWCESMRLRWLAAALERKANGL